MKKILITIVAISLVGFGAGSASAMCDFNAPAKAKGVKASFTRAFASCPGITHSSTNTTTAGGVPGCTPPAAISSYVFGPKGQCAAKSKHVYEKPCKFTGGGTDGQGECANVYITAKCKDIRMADGITAIYSPGPAQGWSMNNLSRATMSDESINGDITSIDFPSQFAFPDGKKGGIKVKGDANQMLYDLLELETGLSACISIENVKMTISDPDGNTFASQGTASRAPQ